MKIILVGDPGHPYQVTIDKTSLKFEGWTGTTFEPVDPPVWVRQQARQKMNPLHRSKG